MSATPTLAGLPAEVLERILSFVERPRDLACANAASRAFHDAPSGRSPIERALRERARKRGHEHLLPEALPIGTGSWTSELLQLERVLELAQAHSNDVAVSGMNLLSGHDDITGATSAFVDAAGCLHTCGEERVYDWNPSTARFRPPANVGHEDAPELLVPTRVASLAHVRVRAVAAGGGHLLALSDAGVVYACGSNAWGQLGCGDEDARSAFVPLRALASELVVGIAAGGQHSLALSAAGVAFSWGHNYRGQLGHGDLQARSEPERIEGLGGVRVGAASAGQAHTLLLSAGGAVYSCGCGFKGRLGHGSKQDQRAPLRIEALAGVRAMHVSAGGAHRLVVDSAGAVYSFGAGALGRLGHGDHASQLSPKRLEALQGMRAVSAQAGHSCSAVLGADGSVHTFGENHGGELGHGHTMGLAAPERVLSLAHERVVCCSLGRSHALFVTVDGGVHSCGKQSGALGHGVSAAVATQDVNRPSSIAQLRCARRCTERSD